MVIDQRPRLSPASHRGVVRRTPPRWGYVSRVVSRYGTVASTVVVYPPEASERLRRRAEVARLYAPVAAAAALCGWIGSAAAGVPPIGAIAAILAVVLPLGIVLSRRARPIRRASAAVSACCSVFGADDGEHARLRRVEVLADTLVTAGEGYRRGTIDDEEFARLWRAVYAHALGGPSVGERG